MKKLVYGIGINDADYATSPIINGKQVECPFCKRWRSMIQRCYSAKLHKRFPTYSKCTVTPEWLFFSKFKRWMVCQDWKGKVLDKDLLVPDNKVYSPETCIFVKQELNHLLSDKSQGAVWTQSNNAYRARLRIYSRKVHIGYYQTKNEALKAYRTAKAKHIRDIAMQQEPRLREGLMRHSESLIC